MPLLLAWEGATDIECSHSHRTPACSQSSAPRVCPVPRHARASPNPARRRARPPPPPPSPSRQARAHTQYRQPEERHPCTLSCPVQWFRPQPPAPAVAFHPLRVSDRENFASSPSWIPYHGIIASVCVACARLPNPPFCVSVLRLYRTVYAYRNRATSPHHRKRNIGNITLSTDPITSLESPLKLSQ